MENSSIFVCKYFVRDRPLYAKVDWKNNDTDLFHIQIYDGQDSWAGRFSKEFAEKYRELVVETEEEYAKNVLAGLTQQSNMFTYDFSLNTDINSAAAFSWKKTFEDGATLVHGSVPIHQTESQHKDSLIDLLLDQNADLKRLVAKYETNLKALSSELEQSKADIEKFVKAKQSLEESLYGKFLCLLNSKKRRIALLEENLEALGTPLPAENDVD